MRLDDPALSLWYWRPGGFLESHWSSVVEGWGSGAPISTKDGGGNGNSSGVDAFTVRSVFPLCGFQGSNASHQAWQQALYTPTHLTGPKMNSLWKRNNIQICSNLQQMRCYMHIKEFFYINVLMTYYQSIFIWIFYTPMQKNVLYKKGVKTGKSARNASLNLHKFP